MGVFRATAPGKIILFGEHAVVYGRPAIAAPLSQLRATAVIEAQPHPGIRLIAPDLHIEKHIAETAVDDAFAVAVREVRAAGGLERLPGMVITVSSDIPIASGLGSGAAITAAVVRALAQFLGLAHLATDAWVSQITYEVEKIHHGTPSGIDNTVVTYEKPVYFVRQEPHNRVETFSIGRPLRLLVADTGESSSTRVVVSDVRHSWQADKRRFERLFDDCGDIAQAAREAIAAGDLVRVGQLMVENQRLLVEMTVSSPVLNLLVEQALRAGALGAKLSGAGRGGNMIALAREEKEAAITRALRDAGARQVFHNVIG